MTIVWKYLKTENEYFSQSMKIKGGAPSRDVLLGNVREKYLINGGRQYSFLFLTMI